MGVNALSAAKGVMKADLFHAARQFPSVKA
jgi:hypothetical protein